VSLPSIEELCLKAPLYKKIELGAGGEDFIQRLIGTNFQFDAFCVECGTDSIFYTDRRFGGGSGPGFKPFEWLKDASYSVEVKCSRKSLHVMEFIFCIKDKELIKFGQIPSLADLAYHEIRSYKKILGADRSRELNRAIGLAAHGAGIGAFAYLRRVFEFLLEDHWQSSSIDSVNAAEYRKLRIDEKLVCWRVTSLKYLFKTEQFMGY